MDHIIPVVDPKTGFTTWDEYIERLFVPKGGWQMLCKSCHDTKTHEVENPLRREYAQKRKDLKDEKDK